MSLEFAEKLIRRASRAFDPNGGGLWKAEYIVTALEARKAEYDQVALVVRRRRDLGPTSAQNILGSVLGGGEEARVKDPARPTLVMFRNDRAERKWVNKGWPAGTIFWIPVLRFPDGPYSFVFNLS